MDVQERSTQSKCFKFPFTDNEEADLNLSSMSSRGLIREKTPLRTKGKQKIGHGHCTDSPSDLSVGLSPIAKSRDSDASSVSCLGSLLGDEVDTAAQVLDATGNSNHNTQQQTPTSPFQAEQISPVSDRSSSPRTSDLQSAMKKVGERSSHFIDKIRDAAHKRKIAVTRSRDSLVAKEQEQLRSIAESKTRLTSLNEELQALGEKNGASAKENNSDKRINSKDKNSYKNNRFIGGFGGVGVPKVEKRPTTTPLSPMLGIRRKGGKTTDRLGKEVNKIIPGSGTRAIPNTKPTNRNQYSDTSAKKAKAPSKRDMAPRQKKGEPVVPGTISSKLNGGVDVSAEETSLFKARKAPSSTTTEWNAGQVGIPKVSKRSVTVPISPCLGPKRQSRLPRKNSVERNADDDVSSKAKMNHSTRTNNEFSISSHRRTMTPSSVKDSPLVGLNLIDSIKKNKSRANLENHESTPSHPFRLPFQPRSTNRAKMREKYDVRRLENRHRRLQEQREKLQSEIKVIRRELKILSKDLT